jgi:hypothetical protein
MTALLCLLSVQRVPKRLLARLHEHFRAGGGEHVG